MGDHGIGMRHAMKSLTVAGTAARQAGAEDEDSEVNLLTSPVLGKTYKCKITTQSCEEAPAIYGCNLILDN